MAKETIRILFIDDSPDDVEQASNILQKGEFVIKTNRIEEFTKLEKILLQSEWDIVLCEQAIPKLEAHQALAITRQKFPQIPFIVLTRKISGSDLQKIMARGANDVIIKGQWDRLLPAIRRELAVARERQTFKETSDKLQALESRYRVMIEGSKEAVSYCHDGMHVDANRAYLDLFGFQDLDELKGMPLLNLVNKNDHSRLKACLRKAGQSAQPHEFTAVNAEGRALPVEMTFTPINISGEECIQVIVVDISKRKALEDKLLYLQQCDCLTGILNRSHFLKELDKAIDSAATENKQHVLICIQINDLEKINLNLGHAECDKMLFMLARSMRETTNENHVLGRIRSSEFTILLTDSQLQEAEALKQALEEKLKALPFGKNGHSNGSEFTIRLVTINQSSKDRKSVLDAGFNKQNTVTRPAKPSEPRLAQKILEATPAEPVSETVTAQAQEPPKTGPAEESTAGFDASNLSLMFQPIINLHGEPAEFFEVLPYIETRPGNYKLVTDFVKHSGQDNLAGIIDRHVIQDTVNLISDVDEQHHEAHFFINISAATFKDDILPTVITQHLKTIGHAANRLYFQLDASDIVGNIEMVKHFITKMKAMGVGIVINNFDNEKITEDDVKDLIIDFLRIDSRLANSDKDNKNDHHLRNAIAGAGALKIPVIVFGVEDAEVFSSLYSMGTHYVQGDYLQPASPDIDIDFTEEQTLETHEISAPNWTLSA